jgi:hypothetical protein
VIEKDPFVAKTNQGVSMRTLVAIASSMTLLVSGAMAADNTGQLLPGKPAGVRQAQDVSKTALIVISGIVVAGVVIGLAASSNGNPGGPVALTTAPSTTS